MRQLIVIFGLFVTYTQVNIFIDSLKLPDSREEQETVVLVGEGESDASSSTTTVTTDPIPEPEIFEPLPFKGKVGKFAKEHGGKVIKIQNDKLIARALSTAYGMKPKKGVKIGDDVYFAWKGKYYVIHGKLIEIKI